MRHIRKRPTGNRNKRSGASFRWGYHRSIRLGELNHLEAINRKTLLLQAVVTPREATTEGQLIEAVALPWFALVEMIIKEPAVVHEIGWRKWEELIAGAYAQEGFDVILTPRSGDRGRDIIASSSTLGRIRFVEQIKAYRPGHVVTADEVRSMVGVLALEPNVSKALITTTSTFAPGIMRDPDICRMMPYRLELKPKDKLIEWLAAILMKRKEAEVEAQL